MKQSKLKMVRKSVFSMFMVLALLVGSVANAAAFQDVSSNHWASKSIAEWAEQGLIKGYEDGSFKPNGTITRAEFMTLVNGGFDLIEEQEISFTDVKAGAWYESGARKAVAAAYLTGYADNTIKPNHKISRQEVAVALAKLLKLGGNESAAAVFTDDIPAWSKGAIGAVVERGYMVGYENGSFGATQSITRAEAVVALDRVIKSQTADESDSEAIDTDWTIEEAGTYGPADGVQEVAGNVNIIAAGVTLQNVTVNGNLTIAESVGEGDVFLRNVTVNGTSYINGGGENSIHLTDTLLVDVTVNKRTGKVRIVVKGASDIKNITLDSKVLLDLGRESKIALATINAISDIVGQGTFANVQINVSGVTFEYEPNKVVTTAGVTAPTITKPGSTAGGSGSTGGGSTGGNNGGSNGGNNGGGTPDTTEPIVTISSLDEESSILATSNETGALYLVLKTADIEVAADLDEAALNDGIKASVNVANDIVNLSKDGLMGTYVIYAVDKAGNISLPSSAIYLYPSEYTLIETPEDLSNVRTGLDGKYVQVKDIDLSAYNSSNGGWEPIGYYLIEEEYDEDVNEFFTGEFDGNGYQITGLYVEGSNDDMTSGLFGVIGEDSLIDNVQIVDATIDMIEINEEKLYAAGALVGVNMGGIIRNSSVTGNSNITSVVEFAGGLVGAMRDGVIIDSNFEGNVTGVDYAGGLVGMMLDGTIVNSNVKGDVTGLYKVGGLVGEMLGKEDVISKIENSSFEGSVNGQYNVGGLVGYLENGQIIDSAASGTVTGNEDVGGLVGSIYEVEITNSYFEGDVYGEEYIGGLVGYLENGQIIDSAASGTITGNEEVGGLVGSIYEGEVTESNASVTVSGKVNVGGLAGHTSSAVKISNSYATGDVGEEEVESNNVGGLVGNNRAEIIGSYATGKVSGNDNVGGLIGKNNSDITNSYATGSVSGNDNVGGLIGINYSDITNGYATGSVSGNNYVGGLIGINSGDITDSSYATGSVSGNEFYVGKLVGGWMD